MNKLPTLIILCFAIGCSKPVQPEIPTVDFTTGFDNKKELINLSEVADSIKYIQLEYTSESLIGRASIVKFCSKHIAVYDEILNKLLLFDINGKFIRNISEAGKGPNEFIGIVDIVLNEADNLMVVVTFDKWIKVFSFDGKIISSFPIEQSPYFASSLEHNRILIYQAFPNSMITKGKCLFEYNLTDQSETVLFTRDLANTTKGESISRVEYYKYLDTICVFEHYYDTLYGIGKDLKMTPRYTYKHNNNYLTSELRKKSPPIESIYHFDFHFESRSTLFFSGVNKGKLARILYNKKDRTFRSIKECSESGANSLHRFGFYNNIDNGYPFWPNGQVNETWFYSVLEPINVKMAYEYSNSLDIQNNNQKTNLHEIIKNIDDLSNPLIMLVKMK